LELPVERRRALLFDEKTRAPFATEVDLCLHQLIEAGVTTGMDGPIPESIADFWRPGGGVLALPRRQHEISTYIAAAEFRRWLRDAATAKEKQRVASASAAKASLWLTSFPTTPELIMADDDFVIAVKHRLGVPLMDDLPPKCFCHAALKDDPQHFLSCSLLKRRAMTVRHDSVVRLLRDFFHHAGALVHIEPRIYETKRFRPDLDILLADTNIMIDVGITNPCAPSRTSTTALAAATTMEKAKVVEYKKFAEERGAKFFPFILETLGAYGKETANVLKVLAKAVFNSNIDAPRDYLVQCNRLVAVAVQRGNALVARQGAVLSRAAAARSAYAEW